MLQDLGSSPASLLAARCRTQAPEPWLFFRRGWKWRWASYGQIADQLARGLRVIRQAATSAPDGVRWGTHGMQQPDAVALACLLIEVDGTLHVRRPKTDGSQPTLAGEGGKTAYWVDAVADVPGEADGPESPQEVGHLRVPTVAGQLDRRPLEALEEASLQPGGMSWLEDDDGSRWTLPELRDRARRLAATLAEGHRPQEASSWLGRWRARRRLPHRPIVCVSPALSPVDLLVVAWSTLALDAVWILEPQGDAFLPTVDWVRPTVVVTDPEHEEELHRRLVALPRGHRRLRTVLSWPSGASDAIDPQLWRELGIDRGAFP